MKIWKFPLPVHGRVLITGDRVVHVGLDPVSDEPMVWAEQSECGNELDLLVVFTGEEITASRTYHRGSVVWLERGLVLHVYEVMSDLDVPLVSHGTLMSPHRHTDRSGRGDER